MTSRSVNWSVENVDFRRPEFRLDSTLKLYWRPYRHGLLDSGNEFAITLPNTNDLLAAVLGKGQVGELCALVLTVSGVQIRLRYSDQPDRDYDECSLNFMAAIECGETILDLLVAAGVPVSSSDIAIVSSAMEAGHIAVDGFGDLHWVPQKRRRARPRRRTGPRISQKILDGGEDITI